jgi:hypothetical protein
MILEIGYSRPIFVESDTIYPEGPNSDHTYQTVRCDGRIRKTCWFRLGEAFLKLPEHRAVTRKEIAALMEHTFSPDGTKDWGTGISSPDMWTTFIHDGFIKKFRNGNRFTYMLSDWGRRVTLKAQRDFSKEFTKATLRIQAMPKTVAEAKQLVQVKFDKHENYLARKAAGFPKKKARLAKAALRAEAKILK